MVRHHCCSRAHQRRWHRLAVPHASRTRSAARRQCVLCAARGRPRCVHHAQAGRPMRARAALRRRAAAYYFSRRYERPSSSGHARHLVPLAALLHAAHTRA
ncbi:hypothetical protein BC826DRAFT_1062910 [Russula brevipes]|nr:hypothetical protein BC826DRAFT_1062910 [Russula brevipes]